ncbi:MAG: flagellar export chaperone FliS [Bdellovibrionales bacterium]|nr:flagellar export chaperone FliS [Bdellovibrionales bacterium]MBL7669297.1 flagellar export chaperone FliS [Pseudobdellovibrionaceae bacterium]
MSNPYQKYKTQSVQSASREKILLMLYEGAIRFTKLAIKACEEKKIADRGQNIGRAYDIVMELNNTLDHKIGGEISKNLEQLYVFIMDLYTKANISGDPVHLKSSLKILENLYDGWVQAVEKLKKENEQSHK